MRVKRTGAPLSISSSLLPDLAKPISSIVHIEGSGTAVTPSGRKTFYLQIVISRQCELRNQAPVTSAARVLGP
jgi:hypothetical protein